MFDLATRRVLDRRLGIRSGDKVLDIGCGGMPFPFATHVADISLANHSGRLGLPIRLDSRPVFECSVENMPFADGQFDFVYCSHVLEHVDDPAAACRELMRVAPRGYIECPRSWVEYVFSAPDHRWLVDFERGLLVFREKLLAEEGDPLGLRMAIFSLLENPEFRSHWDSPRMRKLRTVQLRWEAKFRFVVIPQRERGGPQGRPPVLQRSFRHQIVSHALATLATHSTTEE